MNAPRAQVIAEDARVRVRVVELAGGDASPWHRHTDLVEHVVALSDGIVLEQAEPWVRVGLSRGSVVGVASRRPHRLENLHHETGSYLLIHKGTYDFVEQDPGAVEPPGAPGAPSEPATD